MSIKIHWNCTVLQMKIFRFWRKTTRILFRFRLSQLFSSKQNLIWLKSNQITVWNLSLLLFSLIIYDFFFIQTPLRTAKNKSPTKDPNHQHKLYMHCFNSFQFYRLWNILQKNVSKKNSKFTQTQKIEWKNPKNFSTSSILTH